MLLDAGVGMPWIALDGEEHRNVLAIDVDHADGPDRVETVATAYGLPRPTLVLDPWSGRSHAIIRLRTPVACGPDARPEPQRLADLAGRLLASALGGTLLPRRSLLKSPWGLSEHLIGGRLRRSPMPAAPMVWDAYLASASRLMWHTIPGDDRAVELREIVDALIGDFGDATVPTQSRFRPRRGELSALGRNCALFDATRYWAYDHNETDGHAIHTEASRVNATLPDPLPGSEVAAVARSISKFMASRYKPQAAPSRRGRDQAAGVDLDITARQSLAGKRSSAACSASTDIKIAAAVAALEAAGTPLTQAAIAVAAGVGVRTVQRRWHSGQNPPTAVLSGSAPPGAFRGVSTALPSIHPSPSLAAVSRTDRRHRRETARDAAGMVAWVDRLTAYVATATKPGAVPSDVPCPPADLASIPEVRQAWQQARAAAADARRRAAARVVAAATAARRTDMVTRIRDDASSAWRWFRSHLVDLDIELDALASDPDAAVPRDQIVGARWRQWRAALASVHGRPGGRPVLRFPPRPPVRPRSSPVRPCQIPSLYNELYGPRETRGW